MNVLILSSQSGDWEGLFVNGTLIEESYELGKGDQLFMLGMAEDFGFKLKDVYLRTLLDVDERMLQLQGCFPDSINKFKADYGPVVISE